MAQPDSSDVGLAVVVYHYVRDLPRTRFPSLKGMLTTAFREQVDHLATHFEPATLESAMEFLAGRYRPKRDLCLFTFDDGLKEHYADVLPILRERQIQGTFFVITDCLNGALAAVHKNHFLMAGLGFEAYRDAFMNYVADRVPASTLAVDVVHAQRKYRWDTAEVAAFKYLFNFQLDASVREQALSSLFEAHLGDEGEFARDLYMSWDEARDMQAAGMAVGGHSHRHPALGALPDDRQQSDLATCARQLRRGLYPQAWWPFAYPYGDFNRTTVETLRTEGFDCSFALEVGPNSVGQDLYRLRRFDTNDVPAYLGQPLCL